LAVCPDLLDLPAHLPANRNLKEKKRRKKAPIDNVIRERGKEA